jgi:hypothetical protein
MRKARSSLNLPRASSLPCNFRLATEGNGNTKIAGILTREKVPTFGDPTVRAGRKRAQFARHWSCPYIRLILNDRRAVGEYQPYKLVAEKVKVRDRDGKVGEQDALVERKDGEPIKGYYPAAVTEDEFTLAQAAQALRTTQPVMVRNDFGELVPKTDCMGRPRRTVAGPRQRKYINLFRGLLKNCDDDGEGWLLQNKGKKNRSHLVLVNARGAGGRGPCVTFPYPVLEDAILTHLKEVKAEDVLPGAPPPSRLHTIKARQKYLTGEIAKLEADLAAGYSKTVSKVLRDHEAEHKQLDRERRRLEAEAMNPVRRTWDDARTLMDLLAAKRAAGDDAAVDDIRTRLQTKLRATVEGVWLLVVRPQASSRTRLVEAQVHFAEGKGYRDYFIVYRAGANGSATLWYANAVKQPEAARLGIPFGEEDLRDPDQAAIVRDFLAAFPRDIIDRILAEGGRPVGWGW